LGWGHGFHLLVPVGHVGGGLEYRFTPHIGIFREVGYVFPNLANNNFVQINFALRYAF
jgi:hypothetical protein